jgi:hypothetical protein
MYTKMFSKSCNNNVKKSFVALSHMNIWCKNLNPDCAQHHSIAEIKKQKNLSPLPPTFSLLTSHKVLALRQQHQQQSMKMKKVNEKMLLR